jgi:hypothetical protein
MRATGIDQASFAQANVTKWVMTRQRNPKIRLLPDFAGFKQL